jgi:CSLREA domain-containing protein
MRSLFRVSAAAAVALCVAAQPFDPRFVPATSAATVTVYTVNSSADSDDGTCDVANCTLREAINAANSTPAAATVAFAIPGAGLHVIAIAGGLPQITAPLDIDGRTQPGYIPQQPVIELDGTQSPFPPGAPALWLKGGSSSVRGLSIRHFHDGIIITDGGGDVVEANHIVGDGTVGILDSGSGVLAASPDNVIGGAGGDAARNWIAGWDTGVKVDHADHNVIEGNFLGTDATGSSTSPSLGMEFGVEAQNANVVTIANNVIAGCGDGVSMFNSSNARIANNLIGTDRTGREAHGNLRFGVDVGDDSDLVIESNVISASGSDGVFLSFEDGTIVRDNRIGTDVFGSVALGNGGNGINALIAANKTTIENNVISANGQSGVFLHDRTEDTVIVGNQIGTDLTGEFALGNRTNGIQAESSTRLVVGGDAPTARNIISANGLNGVLVSAPLADTIPFVGSQIQGNLIGTNATGKHSLGNGGPGVAVGVLANGTVIGGTDPAVRNVISGNGADGVLLGDVSDVRVQGNFIGTDVDGTLPIGNDGDGVRLAAGGRAGSNILIGGTVAAAGNVISANGGTGVVLTDPTSNVPPVQDPGDVVLNNRIGTDRTGTQPLGNAIGLQVFGDGNVIGGPGMANVISGNRGDGIEVTGGPGNVVQSNLIGTDITGTKPVGNRAAGVRLEAANDDLIGGLNRDESNSIAFNWGAGISFPGPVPPMPGSEFLGNAIFSNGGLGIDLNADGVTPNDPGDVDAGPNDLQNFPELTHVDGAGIAGTLNSEPNTTYRLEFFANDACDPSGYGEGQNFLGALTVPTDGAGNAGFTFTQSIPHGVCVSATATGPDSGTSEFSGGLVLAPPSGRIVVKKVTRPAAASTAFDFIASYGPGSFTLKDGESNDSGPLSPGRYSVSEAAASGWDLTSATCDNSDRPSAITLGAGDLVTCTFTNTQRGSITITKVTDPASDPQDFAYTTTGAGLSSFSLDTDVSDGNLDSGRSFAGLVAGTFSVTETLPIAGWDFTEVACTSSLGTSTFPARSTTSATVHLVLAPGDHIACTYRNTKRASVAVVKTVLGQPPSATQAFDFQIRSGASPIAAGNVIGVGTANGANGGVFTIKDAARPIADLLLVPGTDQICEFILPGWSNPLGSSSFVPGIANDSTIDNAYQCLNFTLGAGEIRTFTLDNRPPPGGQAKTIGFWKNWASCAGSNGKQKPILDQVLASISGGIPVGAISVTTCPVAVDLLNKSTVANATKVGDGKKMASDPAFNFAAQYLAFKLNVSAGSNGACTAANNAASGGQAVLAAIGFNGNAYSTMSKAQISQLTQDATALNMYNNNTLTC